MVEERVDAAIVGGGMGGLALALALGRRGLSVALLERQADPTAFRRGELIQPNGLAVLDRLGLLQDVLTLPVHRNHRFNFYRIGSGRLLTTDYTELPAPLNYGLIALPRHLVRLVLERVTALPSVRVFLGTTMESLIREDGAVTGLVARRGDESIRIRARIVIGSDGAFSAVRKAAGIPARLHTYREGYLTMVVPRPSGFDHDSRYYVGSSEILGLFPVSPAELYLFYMIPMKEREAVKQAGLAALKRRLAEIDPTLREPLASVAIWDDVGLMPCFRVRARSWVEPGVALMGDAAHAMNPHVAQGRNQALEDAVALDEAIGAMVAEGAPFLESLRAYEARRRETVETLQRQADELTFLWNAGFPPLTWLRDRSFRVLDKNPRLRRMSLELVAGRGSRGFSWRDRFVAAGFLPDSVSSTHPSSSAN